MLVVFVVLPEKFIKPGVCERRENVKFVIIKGVAWGMPLVAHDGAAALVMGRHSLDSCERHGFDVSRADHHDEALSGNVWLAVHHPTDSSFPFLS